MADSRTEQILQAVVSILDGPDKPAGLTINRSRRQSLKPGDNPMISVYPLREETTKALPGRRAPVMDRRLFVGLRCRAQGTDETTDPFRQWAVAALNGNPSLNGLALEVGEEGTAWETADATDADYSIAEMSFSVRYTTARADLTKAA